MIDDNIDEVIIDEENLPVLDGKKRRRESDLQLDDPAEKMLKPDFPPLLPTAKLSGKAEIRRVAVPPHRQTPLRENWMNIYTPIVQNMKLQIRMNTRSKTVEIRTSQHTDDIGALQRAEDFLRAFMMGFDLNDAVALLRLDDIYIDTFEIDDVKPLHGDHVSRAVGRIAGKDGRTKFAIENATRTRIVLAEQKIHILGSYSNIKLAKDAIVSLILGSPPGKVYAKLRNVASRLNEKS